MLHSEAAPNRSTYMSDTAVMTFKTKLQNGRIPLPSRLRTLAGVSDGDPVDVAFVQGRFVVTPAHRSPSAKVRTQRKAVLSRLRAEAPASLQAMWADSRRHGTANMTMREIDALIAEVREERAPKRKVKQSAK
jgi:bifunctional DNA-binding transcriptional regulator/antitoxin component of YhaV-PrlF toxin-antitoxin module